MGALWAELVLIANLIVRVAKVCILDRPVGLRFALEGNAAFLSPNNASRLHVPSTDVNPMSVVGGILASPIPAAGTRSASAPTSSASLRPVLNTPASEAEITNAVPMKCGRVAVAPLAGKTSAPTLALGLLRYVLRTVAQAASARKDSKETTTANAPLFATLLGVLILPTKGFLSHLS